MTAQNHPPVERFFGEHRFLSNFHQGHPFDWQGKRWTTAEHAYQAAKCRHAHDAEAIRLLPTPGEAKRAGRTVALRPDWEDRKLGVMEDILECKFTAPVLREKRLATGNAPLIEGNRWNDTYWGVCRGRGENRLGRLLMSLRENLAQQSPALHP